MKIYVNLNYKKVCEDKNYIRFAMQYDENSIFACDYCPDTNVIKHCTFLDKDKFNADCIMKKDEGSLCFRNIKTLFFKHHKYVPVFMKFLEKGVEFFNNRIDVAVNKTFKNMLDFCYVMESCVSNQLRYNDEPVNIGFLNEVEINDDVYYVVKNVNNNIEMIKAEDCQIVHIK